MLPHALEVICSKVSDEMDVVQEAEKLPGLGSITPEFITVPFQSIRPTRDFPMCSKNLRKSEKLRKFYFRGQKKMGVMRDGRID
jgi:hypothetical protein